MKSIFTKVISIILSICLILTVFMAHSVSVYANDGNKSLRQYLSDFGDKAINAVAQWMCQVGVILDSHDFNQFLDNYYVGKEYWDGNYIHVNDTNDTITLDKELTDLLKQLLKQYSKQENTYVYGWSTGFDEIPYSTFGSWKVCYDTISNVLDTAPSGAINLGISTTAYSGNFYCDIYIAAYDNLRDVGFVGNPDYFVYHYSMSTWANAAPDVYYLRLSSGDSAISSWDEFKEKAVLNQYSNGNKIGASESFRRYVDFCNEVVRNKVPNRLLTDNRLALVTRNRTTFRLFRDTDYLFDYSLGKRGIYFTSDFWDYEPSDFTGTLDDLNNSIDRMDDILKKLLDKIDDKTSESDIEDLLKQILEEIKNGNSSGSGSGSGSSDSKDYSGFFGAILEYLNLIVGYLDEFFGSIFEYLDMIVEYLSGILEGIENLVFLEWTSQDEDIGDLNDIIKGIKDDPETGSQAAADYLTTSFSDIATGLTKKFPFSIPWDLYALFSVFSEVDSPQTISASSGTILPYSIRDGDIQLLDGAGHSRPGIVEPEASNAPFFKLPLVIESAGINENIIIDLSGFQSVSVLSRSLFTVLFALFLLKLTLKILPLFKGGDGD